MDVVYIRMVGQVLGWHNWHRSIDFNGAMPAKDLIRMFTGKVLVTSEIRVLWAIYSKSDFS